MTKLPAPDLPLWLSNMLPFERYCVTVGKQHKMHVMEAGKGPPVLMIHGNPTWGFLYRKVAMLLQHKFRVIMPDLIGFGLSDKPTNVAAHSIKSHSRWLASLIEELDLKDVILVVQDWGGPIGTHAFIGQSSRLAGLVVLNTVLNPPPEKFKPTLFHRFSHVPVLSDIAFRLLGFPQIALHLAQGDKSTIRGIVAKAYRYPFRHMRDRVATLATARMAVDSLAHPSIGPLMECEAFVGEFAGPKAIVWGRQDPILARALKRTKALLGDPPTTETQAGHFLQEEVPGEVADAVIDVKRRLSSP